MSADNWTTCPNCQKKVDGRQNELRELYSIVSFEVYQQKLQEHIQMSKENKDTLREYWELGIWEGKFFVSYHANCEVCGWNYRFKFEDKSPLENKNAKPNN